MQKNLNTQKRITINISRNTQGQCLNNFEDKRPRLPCKLQGNDRITIVRIEFSPLVEIGVNKGHYYPKETTDKGPTQVDAETGTVFKTYQQTSIIRQQLNQLCTVHVAHDQTRTLYVKTLKNQILTSAWSAQHPNTGRNVQQLVLSE